MLHGHTLLMQRNPSLYLHIHCRAINIFISHDLLSSDLVAQSVEQRWSNPKVVGSIPTLAPVVRTMDSAVHRLNHYPADKHWQNQLSYPVDSAIQRLNNWSFPLSLCGPISICRANGHMVYGLKHQHFTSHSITLFVLNISATRPYVVIAT